MNIFGSSGGKSLGCSRVRIVQVTIVASSAGAIVYARRSCVLRIGGVVPVLVSVRGPGEMVAQRALLNNTFFFVVLAYAIRAGITTILAADAFFLVDEDDVVVRVTIGSTRWADADAGRILALLAHDRQPIHLDIGILTGRTDCHNAGPVVSQGYIVLKLALHDARIASGALIEVYDETSLSHYAAPPAR
jgi:hypothetical protein